MSSLANRPPHTGGAVVLSPTPQAFARRILDGLRRQLGRAPTGDDLRAAMALLDGARSELAREAEAAERGVAKP